MTTWLRAAGASDDYQDYYYFLASLGRNTETVATQLLLLVWRQLPLPVRVLLALDDPPSNATDRMLRSVGRRQAFSGGERNGLAGAARNAHIRRWQ